MPEIENNLAHFFAWARIRAYQEFEKRMQADPTLDPNWTFSDIMQELLDTYHQQEREQSLNNNELRTTKRKD